MFILDIPIDILMPILIILVFCLSISVPISVLFGYCLSELVYFMFSLTFIPTPLPYASPAFCLT